MRAHLVVAAAAAVAVCPGPRRGQQLPAPQLSATVLAERAVAPVLAAVSSPLGAARATAVAVLQAGTALRVAGPAPLAASWQPQLR